ncbi:hypothetical protein L0664_18180 [Octadecabacter sp. G9-8]|uniref:Uncharacterized protein n=1 Tax=Octadecabacter dasysiphoniae TaxID=2909341 RepID=A0ABS9D0E5_9RHOB|nr:hypothetical protein [Octadecabacter dasysiphoniae]MCF2872997.1 hypothetical protein [Octadecabacter dasysiphoniae]
MGHLNCKCGAVIELKTGVEEYEKVLLNNDFLGEKLPDLLAQLFNIEASPFVSQDAAKPDFLLQEIGNASASVVFCNSCGRLWLHEKSKGKHVPYVK